MKVRHIAAAVAAVLVAAPVFAYTSPGSPTGYINDFAGVLSTETRQDIEASLVAYEATSTSEIAVAIVSDLDGEYIENYAVRLFEEWGVGKEKEDNGILLVLAIEERELRIEVGYGLEGALTDTEAAHIIESDIVPYLRDGDYDSAIRAGIEKIIAATNGEYVGTPPTLRISSAIMENIGYLFFGGIVVLQWLAAILGRSKPWWPGGVLGAITGLGIGWFFALGAGFLTLIIAVLGVLGLGFDYAVSNAFRTAKSSGITPPWWAGGAGISGRSGGFGGFGGGMSGGGGASGRW